MPDARLPEFHNPPVSEVYIGVQFSGPLITNLYIGGFWDLFKEDYPKHQENSPLSPVYETFGGSPLGQPQLQFSLSHSPFVGRHWFISEDERFLIQLQADRLILNWRRRAPEDDYPRYPNILERFRHEFDRFSEHCAKNDLGKPLLNQCELSYINEITFDDFPNAHGRIGDVVAYWSDDFEMDKSTVFEMGGVNARFIVHDDTGKPLARLYSEVTPVVRPHGDMAIQLQLTCRGKPNGEIFASAEGFFNKCHETIVRAFDALTTKKMHKVWEKNDGSKI